MPTTSLRAADATQKDPERTVRLRVICAPMPPKTFGGRTEIELAMQYLKELCPGVEREDGSMQFECEVRVKGNLKNGNPNFLGPWVHGPSEARHLYLNWLGTEGDERVQFGRMKIHLASITWEQIEAVSQTAGGVLEATVSGVNEKGAPACASVPLLGEGWIVREG
jgi:Family of unknown function (DUF5990)